MKKLNGNQLKNISFAVVLLNALFAGKGAYAVTIRLNELERQLQDQVQVSQSVDLSRNILITPARTVVITPERNLGFMKIPEIKADIPEVRLPITGNLSVHTTLEGARFSGNRLNFDLSVSSRLSNLHTQLTGNVSEALTVFGARLQNLGIDLTPAMEVEVKKGEGQTLLVRLNRQYLEANVAPTVRRMLAERITEQADFLGIGLNMDTPFARIFSSEIRDTVVRELTQFAHDKNLMIEQGVASLMQSLNEPFSIQVGEEDISNFNDFRQAILNSGNGGWTLEISQ